MCEEKELTSKRSKLDIYLDVLKVIRKGTFKPTRIMYKTNLSWKPLTEVLGSLSSQGLVTVQNKGSHKFYHITEKGKSVLQYFSRVLEYIKVR
jgi:predicted transcriptional regulator